MQLTAQMATIEEEAVFAFGRARIVRRAWDAPINITGGSQDHYLEYAMLPRSDAARGCYFRTGRTQPYQPIGEVFFFPAGETVRAQSHCRQQHSIVCTFAPDAVHTWFGEAPEWSGQQLRACFDIGSPNIRDRMSRLGRELRTPGFAGHLMVELLAAEIGIEVARYLLGIDLAASGSGLPSRALRRIDERLASDGAPPTLSELAQLCGISIRHLTRAFRSSRQRSIGQYIAERRVQRARQLLSTGASVKSVAGLLGFRSAAAFSMSFRRSTGERPRDYRRES